MGGRVYPDPDLFVTSTLKGMFAVEGVARRVRSSKESRDCALPCGTSASCLGDDTAAGGDSKWAKRTGIAERLRLLPGVSPLLQMRSTGSTVDDRGLSPARRGIITAGEIVHRYNRGGAAD